MPCVVRLFASPPFARAAPDPAAPAAPAAAATRLLTSVRRSLFITTKDTPNPECLQFLPGQDVMGSGGGTMDFPNIKAALISPLARRLFAMDGIKGVFYGSDFVTVTKDEDIPWALIKPNIFGVIMDFYASGEEILPEDALVSRKDGLTFDW